MPTVDDGPGHRLVAEKIAKPTAGSAGPMESTSLPVMVPPKADQLDDGTTRRQGGDKTPSTSAV